MENRVRHPIGGPLKSSRDINLHCISRGAEERRRSAERRRPRRRLTNRDSRKCQRLGASRSFALVTPDTFDFGENGLYQPVHVKGSCSRTAAPRRGRSGRAHVFPWLLRRNFQHTQTRSSRDSFSLSCPRFWGAFALFPEPQIARTASRKPSVQFTHFRKEISFPSRCTYRLLESYRLLGFTSLELGPLLLLCRFPIDGIFDLSLK